MKQRHADHLSMMHTRYVIAREVTPWANKLIQYLTYPKKNEDSEPHSKQYNAKVTDIQNLEQNRSKRPKTQNNPQDPRTNERARTNLHTIIHRFPKPTIDLASTHLNPKINRMTPNSRISSRETTTMKQFDRLRNRTIKDHKKHNKRLQIK